MEKTPTHLDLFSGIGGFSIAARWAGFRTVAFVEIDGWCRKVLAKNFMAYPAQREDRGLQSGGFQSNLDAGSPIYSDIFDFDGTAYRGVSLITGGFPCQPFSVAGKRGGAGDDRAIWPEMFRVIGEARPAWVLGENVPGIIPMELDNVLSDLEGIGYATRAFIVPACAVDARHRRDRVWIVGRDVSNSECERRRVRDAAGQDAEDARERSEGEVSRNGVCDPAVEGLPDRGSAQVGNAGGTESELERSDSGDWCRWEPEPCVGRVANGVSRRVDRLKGLGNAIVPQVAYEILREIYKEIIS